MKLFFTWINQPAGTKYPPKLCWQLFSRLREEANSLAEPVEKYLKETYTISFIFNSDTHYGISGLDIPDDQLTLLLLKYSI